MKISYKQRLFLYFAITFTLFTITILTFEHSREKKFKTEALIEKLDAYVEMINTSLQDNPDHTQAINNIIKILPANLRLSLINQQGIVQYDNSIKELTGIENHATRPEIFQAIKNNTGTNIRTSTSTNQAYIYYAKNFGNYFIRVALPYDIRTQRFLKSDNLFLYFILIFFLLMLILTHFISGRFGKSISQLRDFVMLSDKEQIPPFNFPKDELGEIGTKITENYSLLKQNEKKIAQEREKLLQHVHSLEEGICFFTHHRKVEFYNGLFIQYLNTLTVESNSDPTILFTDPTFSEIIPILADKENTYFETQIKKQGKIFSLRLNLFDDGGFEIILNDITKQERTRRLKQEMTGNIAHELRTPVTSIRGYLETVLEQSLNEKDKQHFIRQAYNQTIILSELMRDMTLITKIEEAPQSFPADIINISQLLTSLKNDLSIPLHEQQIDMQWNIDEHLTIKGNHNLLYAIFRNLTENSIRYAGRQAKIRINAYNEDNDYYYFSFYDTGIGIPDETHLNRLFERFYRINEGRTRDTGGSGLGLSIVKNAVAFHKGTIVAKNRAEGGLEFLFQLHK